MAMNMSYCRIENTLMALKECEEAFAEECDPFEKLSDDERYAATRLLRLCRQLADDYEVSEE